MITVVEVCGIEVAWVVGAACVAAFVRYVFAAGLRWHVERSRRALWKQMADAPCEERQTGYRESVTAFTSSTREPLGLLDRLRARRAAQAVARWERGG